MTGEVFPWGPFVGGVLLGLSIGWMGMRVWRGKAVLPGANKSNPEQFRWMFAGLFPASGFFIFAALARAANSGIQRDRPLAISIISWPVFCIAAGLCAASILLLVALLLRPSLVRTKLRFLEPPRSRSPRTSK
jgi:hypothetical protein